MVVDIKRCRSPGPMFRYPDFIARFQLNYQHIASWSMIRRCPTRVNALFTPSVDLYNSFYIFARLWQNIAIEYIMPISRCTKLARWIIISITSICFDSFEHNRCPSRDVLIRRCHSSCKTNEPRREKTGLRGFRPGPTQTGLYKLRKELEAWNFGFK